MSDTNKVITAEPATTKKDWKQTEVGSVFVSNYPPYSFWTDSGVTDVKNTLNEKAGQNAPLLGLYLHIPFCRKRCKFCYFRVYTDRNAADIQRYLDALAREVELYSELPRFAGRTPSFVYFGGGTPSYISVKHLKALVDRVKATMTWENAEEVAFECEPGTLTQSKLVAIREIGVTRLSLGIENLSDEILRENGRAHVSKEVYEVMPWIKDLGFNQVNVDLISGMVGETWDSWKDTVQRTLDLDPDSLTIYQMELPFNTVYSKAILGDEEEKIPVADWELKREWHAYAIDSFTNAGYEVSSAYTLVKKGRSGKFLYRDSLWRSSDLIGAGVASFSHVNGLHFQNQTHWDGYLDTLEAGELPLNRAFVTTHEERLTREMILQLKLGRIRPAYFEEKFGLKILERFGDVFDHLREEEMLTFDEEEVQLTRRGLLQVDQLLPEFYDTKYRNARYT
jgi:oxygen-independent coproporphyrinogen-3 oxidase